MNREELDNLENEILALELELERPPEYTHLTNPEKVAKLKRLRAEYKIATPDTWGLK